MDCRTTVLILVFVSGVIAQKNASDGPVYRVSTIVEPPFLMINEGQYEGYIVDLMQLIAKKTQINYELQLVKDERFGGQHKNGTWNGLIGEIERDEADIAAASLTMTERREQVVSFTNPFMIMGVGLMMNKKDIIESTDSRSRSSLFMQPYSWQGWLCIVLSFIGLYISSLLIGRFHPREGSESPPNLKSCSTHVHALLCGAPGMDKRPPAMVILLVFVCCYSIILLLLYTAGLLSIVNRNDDVVGPTLRYRTLKDVLDDPKIAIGALKDSSTANSFARSRGMELHERLNLRLAQNPNNLASNIQEAVKRTESGGYAFLTESKTLEYIVSRNCALVRVGQVFDHKSYALATQKNSTLREKLNVALIKLMENQQLLALEHKWFKSDAVCPTMEVPKTKVDNIYDEEGVVVTRKMSSLLGPFAFVFIGVVLAWAAVLAAVVLKRRKQSTNDEKTNEEEQNGTTAGTDAVAVADEVV